MRPKNDDEIFLIRSSSGRFLTSSAVLVGFLPNYCGCLGWTDRARVAQEEFGLRVALGVSIRERIDPNSNSNPNRPRRS